MNLFEALVSYATRGTWNRGLEQLDAGRRNKRQISDRRNDRMSRGIEYSNRLSRSCSGSSRGLRAPTTLRGEQETVHMPLFGGSASANGSRKGGETRDNAVYVITLEWSN